MHAFDRCAARQKAAARSPGQRLSGDKSRVQRRASQPRQPGQFNREDGTNEAATSVRSFNPFSKKEDERLVSAKN